MVLGGIDPLKIFNDFLFFSPSRPPHLSLFASPSLLFPHPYIFFLKGTVYTELTTIFPTSEPVMGRRVHTCQELGKGTVGVLALRVL